jgi:hypothetical protein
MIAGASGRVHGGKGKDRFIEDDIAGNIYTTSGYI